MTDCPCGSFPKCNNGEGCDTCKYYEEWLREEEKEVTR